MSVRAHLVRGVVAGLIAGLLVGVFALLVAEPVIDRAVDLESARVSAQYQHDLAAALLRTHGDAAAAQRAVAAPPPAVFSRGTQHLGLIVATGLFGLGVGGVFAILFLVVSRRPAPGSAWRRALGLAAAMFAGLYLLPFIRYPANPPGVGDPTTIDRRTYAFVLAVAIASLAVGAAWRLARELRARGVDEPLRHLAVALILVAALVVEFTTLPDDTDPVRVPADLLWDFRVRSLATQVLLWAVMAATFGLLTERALRRDRVRPPRRATIADQPRPAPGT